MISDIKMGDSCMKEKGNDAYQEKIVLSLLDRSSGPVGAGTVKEELRSFGYELSEATVGRFLRELDKRGLTCRVGFQGRRLTELGQRRLSELEEASRFDSSYKALLEKIAASEALAFQDFLEARIAIEIAVVRLAAVKRTTSDLHVLAQKVEELKVQETYEGIKVVLHDFHRALIKASGNAILEAVMELLFQKEVPVGGNPEEIAGAYMVLFDSIEAKDPQKAEEALFKCFQYVLAS